MKGDALTSLGLCTVSLLGVYNWRGTGSHGGITALGDWESVHLKGSADLHRLRQRRDAEVARAERSATAA
jgi:hypothetical protein